MKTVEYLPLPDEFNLGYVSKNRIKEDKKKKKFLKRLSVFAMVTLLLFPLTIKQGLNVLGEPSSGENKNPIMPVITDTGVSGKTYVFDKYFLHFDENTGWFFDGNFFIPMTYNQDTNEYDINGNITDNFNSPSFTSTVHYLHADGVFTYNKNSVNIINPYTMTYEKFTVDDHAFNDEHIKTYNRFDFNFKGKYQGMLLPDLPDPAPYVKDVEITDDYFIIFIGDTHETDKFEVYSFPYEFSNGIIKLNMTENSTYTLEYDEYVKEFVYDDPLDVAVFITETGIYLGMNLFGWQVLQIH